MSLSMRILVFLLLVLFSSLSVVFCERYQDVGPELLSNQDFKDGLNQWQASGARDQIVIEPDGVVSLTASDAKETVQIFQKFFNDQKRFQMLRLRGSLRVDTVLKGQKSWHRARLLLASYDAKGKWLPVSHQVVALEGTHDWQTYETVFHVLPEAHEIRVILQLSRCTGTVWAQGISLRQVEEAQWYPWLKMTVLGLWAVFLLWIIVACVQRGKIGKLGGAFLGVSFLVLLVGIAMPADVKHDLQESFAGHLSQADGVQQFVKKILQEDRAIYFSWLSPSRITHFFLFAAFGFFGSFFSKGKSKYFLLDLLMLAVATEMIQFYVEGRTPQFGDGAADFAGGLAAVLVVQKWRLKALGLRMKRIKD